tara:strand:+ start:3033 stop:3251 length:219 start_codon:yes stop_codon:yes gene_type:complete
MQALNVYIIQLLCNCEDGMSDLKKDYEELFKLKPITKDERMKQLRVLKPETKEKLRAMKRRLKDGSYHDKKQ